MQKYREIIYKLTIITLLVFTSFICFYKLDYFPIRVFDESRQAINASEMFENGKFLYTTYDKEVDFWNTKPPLLIWMQAGLMHVVGVNEIAVRLPSALAGLGLSILLLWISIRYLKSFWVGILSVLCLFSCSGFVTIHALKTGDYEALLTFLSFSLVLFMYVYFETNNIKYLVYSSIAVTLAILCKGIAGLLFLPGILLYVLYKRKLFYLLQNKHFWICFLIPLVFGIGYYPLREWVTPGYLEAIWNNELGGRYSHVNEGNSGIFRFYFDILVSYKFGRILFVLAAFSLPLALFTGFFKNFSVLLNVVFLSFLSVISFSETKLIWYIVPAFPLLSLMSSITVVIIFLVISKFISNFYFKIAFFSLSIIFLFGFKLKKVVTETIQPIDPEPHNYVLANHFRDALKGKHTIDPSYTFVNFEHYYPHYKFYLKELKAENLVIKNFNELNTNFPLKIATGIDVLSKNIENSLVAKKVKTIKEFNYYHVLKILPFERNRLTNFEIEKYQFNKQGFAVVRNSKDPKRIVVVSKSSTSIAEGSFFFYFQTVNNDIRQTEVVEFKKWDGINFEGSFYRFIQLFGDAEQVLFVQKNKGKEVWKSEQKFQISFL